VSEDKRTKIGATGPAKAIPAATPAPVAPDPVSASSMTEVMMPGATPVPSATPPPVGTPAPAQHQTSYLPPAEPQVDPLLGQVLAGRYHIQKKLGEGGMGAVYLAMHQLLEKQVALKVLHNEFARKPDLVERFIQEAKAASRIRHENVIDISDFGSTPEGVVFFAMELLSGHDLHEEVSRARLAGQLLPYSRTKKIFLQICSALSAAHARGIVHRDLKPENIYLVDFLGDADFVKLLDFGIAKLTEVNEEGRKLTKTGMLFGTPEYMSPEQARGEHVDHRVDIYAMGCILFQLVTGRVPFEAENFMGVLSLHLTEHPPEIPAVVFERIGAPPALAQVIDKALAKDRDQRYQSIDDLANAVRQVSGDPLVEPGRATGVVPAQRPASVQAPEKTTQARSPTPAPVQPTTGDGRQRTQWTGSLQVPTVEDRPPSAKSKLPVIIGALVVLAIAGVVVFFATRGPKTTTGEPGPGTASGSAPGPGSQVVTVPPDAAPVPPPEPLPEYSYVTLDTSPHGAKIIEVATNKVWGTTPKTLRLSGSRDARQFQFSLKGYSDSIFEIRPDKEKVDYKEDLQKGAAGTVVKHVGTGSGSGSAEKPNPNPGSGAPVTHPDSGSGQVKVKIDAGVPVQRPPGEDCDDPPCIKTVVPGLKKCTKDEECPVGLSCKDAVCK